MDDRTIRRLTGWAAWGMVVFWAAQFPLYLVHDASVVHGGPLDPAGFYNAAGWGPVVVANLPPAVWVVLAAVFLLRGLATAGPPGTVTASASEAPGTSKAGDG